MGMFLILFNLDSILIHEASIYLVSFAFFLIVSTSFLGFLSAFEITILCIVQTAWLNQSCQAFLVCSHFALW